MNAEIAQMIEIVMCARKAFDGKEKIEFRLRSNVRSVIFTFLRRGFIIKKQESAQSVNEWCEKCKHKGIAEIKLFVPTPVRNREALICYWKNGEVSFFSPEWTFDSERKEYSVEYTEHKWNNAPKIMPSFPDQTEAFKKALHNIERFADDIGFPHFAHIFNQAYSALCGTLPNDTAMIPGYIPNDVKGLYYAILKADVFGGMGSWNDSPPYYACDKGRIEDYNKLSDELYTQIENNLMYVVNEC